MGILAFLMGLLALLSHLLSPVATLGSLEQVDDYPLYTMTYYGDYETNVAVAQAVGELLAWERTPSETQPAWACSLFAALGDPERRLYGRNFDWEFSPAVLLFADPPDGYASVSMVDIAYLGFGSGEVGNLADLPLSERAALLQTPYLPFDGMNAHGLVVGMAAVPPGDIAPDPDRETIDSLDVIREILDHARTVDEAVDILGRYNIDMTGGPPLHYLIADVSGRSVLVEFYQGAMYVTPNEAGWHLATNFLRVAAGDSPREQCWRYARIDERLTETEGQLTTPEALALLRDVSQPGTQWSIVYEMSTGSINVAMGRQYDDAHRFRLPLVEE